MAQEALSPDLVKNRFLRFLSGDPCLWNLRPTPKSQPTTRKQRPPSRLDSSLSRILFKTEVPGLRPRLSYVPHFPKRAGFPPSPFPPSPAYRSKLVSASSLVGFLASPTEVGEWIFPTRDRCLRVSARCFYPLGQFQFYSLMDLRQGEKNKKFRAHFMCKKSVSLQRVRGLVLQAESAHFIHRIFHTALKSLRIVSHEGVSQTVV